MSRVLRFLALALPLTVVAVPQLSCKTTGEAGRTRSRSPKQKKLRRKPGMPRPLRLPANPPAVLHVQAPRDVLLAARTYSTRLPGPAQVAQRMLGRGDTVEAKVGAMVDFSRPWTAAVVDGQRIMYMPIARNRLQEAQALTRDLPPEGKFGAVRLPRSGAAAEGPKLLWIDPDTSTVTFADDLQGIATGRELSGAYGKDPLWFSVDGTEARKLWPGFPLNRFTIKGVGPHDFTATAEGVPTDSIPELQVLTEGALTNMLDSKQVAVGASSKYAGYDQAVRGVIARATREVKKQNFLIRGTLEDLLRRFNAVARQWNGKVFVGVGPKQHVLVGLGTDDPKKAGGALLHLVGGAIDNLKLARTFGVSVPRLNLKKNVARGGETGIHELRLRDARRFLPAEAGGLIDGSGTLTVAMAFPSRAGGVMFVAGPTASKAMKTWLEQTNGASRGRANPSDLVAATVAVRPEQLRPLLTESRPDGRRVLALNANTDPTKFVLRRNDTTFELVVKGPKIPTAAPRRVAGRPPGVAPGVPVRIPKR